METLITVGDPKENKGLEDPYEVFPCHLKSEYIDRFTFFQFFHMFFVYLVIVFYEILLAILLLVANKVISAYIL